MSKLSSLLNKEPLTLIVRLPENSLEMAKAAEEGGAHAVCLNMDISDKDKIEAAKTIIYPKEIRSVFVEHHEGNPYILIELTENGKKILNKVTSENIGKGAAEGGGAQKRQHAERG